ncbi:MAG: DUF2062 domain-containing protein [Pirellulales bacterium]|nr:DUF2062 domain-containing protein [Pirellulales bacterium]
MRNMLVWKRLKNFFTHNVLHVDDTPHRIALGVAIGVFVTWTPTIGFQMVLTIALAWLLRANKFVGVPFVWISNPLTLVPIYMPNYLIGRWILGSEVPPPDFAKVVDATGGWLETVGTWWSVTWHAFLPLWLGSLLVGLALAIPSYFATYRALVIYRRKLYNLHLQHIERKHHRRELDIQTAESQDETDSGNSKEG